MSRPKPTTQAVLYAAKSTDDEKGSIPDQLSDGRKLAAERGLQVVAEHQDEAASAYSGDRGPGLAKALAECERLSAEHGSCALIVQRSDRLARGDGKQARSLVEITLWAIKHDVELHSVQDPEILAGGDMALLMSAIGGLRGNGESKVKAESVRKGMRRRAERGEWVGGHPPYGYASAGRYEPLSIVPAQAAVVRRIFADYATGVSQKALVRRLNEDKIPTATGAKWGQSRITRMLSQVAYIGKQTVKDDDGQRTRVLDATHEAIVDDDLWRRVQATRSGASRRKGGRHADGGHLLVRGVLRCRCGAAMIPRKARQGVERERYVCAGRIADPGSCSQPSIRRERIDAPLLATLLDGYIDLEATQQRIEQRASTALAEARQAVADTESELARAEARLARVQRGWQDAVIDDAEYARQKADLDVERSGALAAAERAQAHADRIERMGGVGGDAEQALLEHLGKLKRAVGDGASTAPDLAALRNVIGDLFQEVQLVLGGEYPEAIADGVIPWHDNVPAVADGDDRYWLLLVLRTAAVDDGTLKPIGQAMPVPAWQSYPEGFLARYCWW